MSTSAFPGALDTYTNPTATNTTNNPSLAAGQTLQNDSLAALETKIGVDGSAVTTTLDYKVKNAASPINSAISTLQQSTGTLYTDTGTANAYVITPSISIGSYTAGQSFSLLPSNSNTGASTLNVNGLGSKNILYQGVALSAGNIVASTIVRVIYDGSQFQLQEIALGSWIAYTPTFTGFSTPPVVIARYQKSGKVCSISMYTVSAGTSNSNTFTFTLPFATANIAQSIIVPVYVQDNGVYSTGFIITAANTAVATVNPSGSNSNWTTSGAKFCQCSLTYETA